MLILIPIDNGLASNSGQWEQVRVEVHTPSPLPNSSIMMRFDVALMRFAHQAHLRIHRPSINRYGDLLSVTSESRLDPNTIHILLAGSMPIFDFAPQPIRSILSSATCHRLQRLKGNRLGLEHRFATSNTVCTNQGWQTIRWSRSSTWRAVLSGLRSRLDCVIVCRYVHEFYT